MGGDYYEERGIRGGERARLEWRCGEGVVEQDRVRWGGERRGQGPGEMREKRRGEGMRGE